MQDQPLVPASYSHTTHYGHLEVALKSRWGAFKTLCEEMDNFSPKTKEDFSDYRVTQLARLHELNPGSEDEELLKIIDGQIAAHANPAMQFHYQFADRFMGEYVLIVVTAHALCEAVINAILAIGLASLHVSDVFGLVERAQILEKWRIGPKTFCPSYELPKGNAMYESLRKLTKQRNALVHQKITLEMGGKEVIKGSSLEMSPFSQEIAWIRRFFSLPYDLAAYALRTIPHPVMLILGDSAPIEMAEVHAQ